MKTVRNRSETRHPKKKGIDGQLVEARFSITTEMCCQSARVDHQADEIKEL